MQLTRHNPRTEDSVEPAEMYNAQCKDDKCYPNHVFVHVQLKPSPSEMCVKGYEAANMKQHICVKPPDVIATRLGDLIAEGRFCFKQRLRCESSSLFLE
jgi:hypothetical protein